MAILACLCLAAVARAEGYRTTVGEDKIPLVVVKGTPYEMGHAFGKLMQPECQGLIGAFLKGAQLAEHEAFTKDPGKPAAARRYTDAILDAAWKATSPHIHKRFRSRCEGWPRGRESRSKRSAGPT